MIVLEVLGHILFWLVMVTSILIIPIGIPGTFIIVCNALVYGWLTGFAQVTWGMLGVLLFIALAAEGLEFFIGAAAAGKYGGSRTAMFGAILGGIFGAIWGTSLLPLIGTLVGAFAGAFAGAAVFEYSVTKDWDKALRVGFGAFLGTLGGKVTKIAAATAMVVMVGVRVYS
ncbi:MAG: DUF456 family protein [bacterium]